ncbi:MAG: hypothetical protein HQ556_08780 [Candidatus Marinimicrobia bacterium]|nr:hypothetical protein [Candidatus Neomarinimicrobiota bacterium]
MKHFMSVAIALLLMSQVILAQTIAVQGVLRDPAGRTVVDGSHTVVFKLYDAETGGSELWTETHGSVSTSHGVFSEKLGESSSMASLSFTDQYWLGIQVDDGTEISQRLPLQSSPSANAVTGSANIVPSTGNVGIGTLSPSNQLEVTGSGIQRVKVASDDDQAGLSFESDGSGEFVIYTPGSSDDLNFYNGTDDVMTLTNDGKLGIGTTTPISPLHVTGTAYIEGSVYTQDRLRLMREAGPNYIDYNNAQTLNFRSITPADGEGVNKMTFATSGNIGVGNETPSELLDVGGNLKISNGGALIFADGSSLASADLGGTAAAVAAPGNTLITADSDADGVGEIQFKTGLSTDMVITNAGHIGIGTASPTYQLDVAGAGAQRIVVTSTDDQAGISFESDGTGRNVIYTPDDSDDLQFWSNAVGDHMRLTASGNLGIGTNLPQGRLHVAGTSHFEDRLKLMRPDGINYIDYNSDYAFVLRSATIAGGGHTPRFTINPLGNVGINETDPSAKLTIDSDGDGDLLNIQTSHTTDNNIFQVQQAGSDGLVKVNNANGETQTQLSGYSGTPSYFMTNVGVGNSSPGALLDVGTGAGHNGSGNFQIMASGVTSAGLAANIGLRSIYLFATPTQMKLDAYDYDTATALDIAIAGNGGNVGVGTTTPTTKLDVAGRITRHGQALSESGSVSNNGIITVPWGTRDDWNIFVSPRSMGQDETGSMGDNAMMIMECYASATASDQWTVIARYIYRNSSDHSNAAWYGGTANYLLVPR